LVNIVVSGAIDKTTAQVIEAREVLPATVRPMFGTGKRVFIVNARVDKETVRSQSKIIQSVLGKSGERLSVTHASIGKYKPSSMNIGTMLSIREIFGKYLEVPAVKSS
jgi:hypothetical protein